MPLAVMVMVGGPEAAGAGVGDGGGVETGGVGDGAVAPPEHAATAIKTMKRQRLRSTASPHDLSSVAAELPRRRMTEGALRTRV